MKGSCGKPCKYLSPFPDEKEIMLLPLLLYFFIDLNRSQVPALGL